MILKQFDTPATDVNKVHELFMFVISVLLPSLQFPVGVTLTLLDSAALLDEEGATLELDVALLGALLLAAPLLTAAELTGWGR